MGVRGKSRHMEQCRMGDVMRQDMPADFSGFLFQQSTNELTGKEDVRSGPDS